MSFGSAHPALYASGYQHDAHFVPEGWEDTDRGVCPCGELVTWDDDREKWIVDRTLNVFVLRPNEKAIMLIAVDGLSAGDPDADADNVALKNQLSLQEQLNDWDA